MSEEALEGEDALGGDGVAEGLHAVEDEVGAAAEGEVLLRALLREDDHEVLVRRGAGGAVHARAAAEHAVDLGVAAPEVAKELPKFMGR